MDIIQYTYKDISIFLTINPKISFVKIPKLQTHKIDYQTKLFK